MIFHRSPGQAETVPGLDAAYPSAGGCIGILDGLRLIQDGHMPIAGEQEFVIARDQWIGGQDHIMLGNGIEVLSAVGAVKHQNL